MSLSLQPPQPWWLQYNIKARYYIQVIDIRTGQVVFHALASDVRDIALSIVPVFQALKYPIPSTQTIYQMRSGRCQRNKNGFCLADVLKIQDLRSSTGIISSSTPVDVTGPTALDVKQSA